MQARSADGVRYVCAAKAGGWQTVGGRMEAIDHSLSARHSTKYATHIIVCVLHAW